MYVTRIITEAKHETLYIKTITLDGFLKWQCSINYHWFDDTQNMSCVSSLLRCALLIFPNHIPGNQSMHYPYTATCWYMLSTSLLKQFSSIISVLSWDNPHQLVCNVYSNNATFNYPPISLVVFMTCIYQRLCPLGIACNSKILHRTIIQCTPLLHTSVAR